MKSKKHLFGFLPFIWFIVCTFLSEIKSDIIYYDGTKYFFYNADNYIKSCITIVTIIIICALAIYNGYLKNRFNALIFIAFLLFFKIVIFVSQFINPTFSDLLYCVYFSPICSINEHLDIFSYLFYELVFLIPFMSAYFIKNIQKNKQIKNL